MSPPSNAKYRKMTVIISNIFWGKNLQKWDFFFIWKKNQNKIAALDFLEQIFKRPFDFNF